MSRPKYSYAKVCPCYENKRVADYSDDSKPVWRCINCNRETPRRLSKAVAAYMRIITASSYWSRQK